MDAHDLRAGTLDHRAAYRRRESEDFDELMLLRDLDDQGRRCGAIVCSLDEAFEYLRRMQDLARLLPFLEARNGTILL